MTGRAYVAAAAAFWAVLGLALAEAPPPIIDMHMHALSADDVGPPPVAICEPMLAYMPPLDPGTDEFSPLPEEPPCDDPFISAADDAALLRDTIAVMERRNVIGVLSGPPERVRQWVAAAPDRFIPSIQLQIGRDDYSNDELRRLVNEEGFRLIGEVSNQYVNIAPDDKRMRRYWAIAGELDIPVAIHLGEGPAGAAYMMPDYRPSLSNPFLLEPVLARHPKLRVSVMHYGSPMIDEMIAMMGAYPQLYVDIGGIQWFYPRAYFYGQLKEMVDAGLAKRIMFGSDLLVWPGLIERSIDIIEEAPFLTDEQKRDILYNNAARFLRLDQPSADSPGGQ